ncbi:MAG: glucose-1-phosphate thymidylyltransferase RfbA [Candidatus Calescibacterium sp.]|nr:glucose-1-phosphate thymidylyltransferase RfbA [Candidatus Calescibacterium sp.]MDW8087915.1 glucose-1-phosphate thymidylyltransferase RfbA [Candidatus Calescibacterium sp.]
MKGVILAGGRGTRLYPLTYITNKHLLPIYNKPMIYYPFSVLMLAKIREVIIVTNPEDLQNYKILFGDGSFLGMRVYYAVQDSPRGLSDGLMQSRKFADGDSVMLTLGDNIFFGHGLPEILKKGVETVKKEGGACVFAYYVNDPERFGVVEFDEFGSVLSLEEKPKKPKSNYAVTGLYIYDETVFEKIERLKPSDRGELEITSLNEEYLKEKKLKVEILGRGFAWFDAGTYDSFLEAGEFVATIEKKTGLMVGCIEEIAYRNKWITKDQLMKLAKNLEKTDYGQYLKKLAETI